MWMISEHTSEATTTEENHVIVKPLPKLQQLFFVKSSLTVNPCMVIVCSTFPLSGNYV